MSRLAFLIPCRSGSKRIPDKNIQQIGDHTLLSLAVIKLFTAYPLADIYICSDSIHYFNDTITRLPQSIPRPRFYQRSSSTSNDVATLEDFLKEFLSNSKIYQEYSNICVHQCTSPLLSATTIRSAIAKYLESDFNSLFTCLESHSFFWTFSPSCHRYVSSFDQTLPRSSTAVSPKQYIENGGLYLLRTSSFLSTSVRSPHPALPYSVSHLESLDIDDEVDLQICRSLFTSSDIYNSIL